MDAQSPSNSKPDIFSVCRLCLEVSTKSLYSMKYLDICLSSILPNLDLSLSKDPGICENCTTTLMDCYNLKNRCFSNQERILIHYNTLSKPVDLYNFVTNEHFVKSINNIENISNFNCDNVKETDQVDGGAQLLQTATVHSGFENDIKGTTSLKQRVNIEVGNGIISQNEAQDSGSKWCFNDAVDDDDDDDKDMVFVEECSFKLTEDDLNEDYISNIKSDQEMYSSKFVDGDEVVFNYTLDFEDNVNKEAVKNNCENDKSVIKPDNPFLLKELPSIQSQPKCWKKLSSKLYQCLMCQKKFVQKVHLDSHLLNKHKDIPNIKLAVQSKIHYCHYCPYCTVSTCNLVSHMLSRHGKTLKSKHKLKRMSCLRCNYSTHNKGNLVIHMRIHNPVKLFSCIYCKKSFNQKSTLNCHYLNRHGKEENVDQFITGRVYVCDICPFKTLDKSKNIKHLEKHLCGLL